MTCALVGALLLCSVQLAPNPGEAGWEAEIPPDPVTVVTPPSPGPVGRAFRCTAYTATGNRTRTGTWPAWGTVAVDPSVIPLGSRLTIDAFPGSVFVAEDTGGGVQGAHVDVYMPSRAQAVDWGVRACTVRVL